jgi:UDP-glucuronate decarboxylase
MNNLNLLITGGDGFLGRHFIARFHSLFSKIYIIDNHLHSYPIKYPYPHIETIQENIADIDSSSFSQVDIILHFASTALPLVFESNFQNIIDANVLGSMKLVQLAKRFNAKLFYASTSEVYGFFQKPVEGGIKETEIPRPHLLTTRSVYANAKRLGEDIIAQYIKSNNHGTILRLFNVYGPDMDVKNTSYGRVIPNFFNHVLLQEPFVIFGDGKQTRSFLWIEDFLSILIKIIQYPKPLPLVINIGNPQPNTIIDLANLIMNFSQAPLPIQYQPTQVDDTYWRMPNISLLKSYFDWHPQVNLNQGLNVIWDKIKK